MLQLLKETFRSSDFIHYKSVWHFSSRVHLGKIKQKLLEFHRHWDKLTTVSMHILGFGKRFCYMFYQLLVSADKKTTKHVRMSGSPAQISCGYKRKTSLRVTSALNDSVRIHWRRALTNRATFRNRTAPTNRTALTNKDTFSISEECFELFLGCGANRGER